jgi:hypothetical protein
MVFLCFPVVIAENLEYETITFIKQLDMPKHWASLERLVVFNLADSKLYYSAKRPLWGSLYHELDRSIIDHLLGLDN